MQGIQQFLRWIGVGAIVLRLRLVQLAPAAANPLQGLFQYRRGRLAQGLEVQLVELGRIHLARSFHQVVRFVHQHRYPPLVGAGQAIE
ncbi:hypothetical protein D3C76_1309890 [compost metagenome]